MQSAHLLRVEQAQPCPQLQLHIRRSIAPAIKLEARIRLDVQQPMVLLRHRVHILCGGGLKLQGEVQQVMGHLQAAGGATGDRAYVSPR